MANIKITALAAGTTVGGTEVLEAVQSGDSVKLTADQIVARSLAKASNLSDLASAATARTNLGLGTAATHATGDYDASGAAAAVLATSAQKASNLSDLASAATARTNLGVIAAPTVGTPGSGIGVAITNLPAGAALTAGYLMVTVGANTYAVPAYLVT